jgi:hypothetical protein
MFRERSGRIEYQTGTTADDWHVVTEAVALDAGDNELARVPAAEHEALEARFTKAIREGRVYVVAEWKQAGPLSKRRGGGSDRLMVSKA